MDHISAESLAMIQRAIKSRDEAVAVYNFLAQQIIIEYHVGQSDAVDLATGIITRGNHSVEGVEVCPT